MKGKAKKRIWRKVVALTMVVLLMTQLVSSPLSSVYAESTKDEDTPMIDSTEKSSETKDYDEVVELEKVTEETVDLQSLAVDENGVVHYNGEPLYVGKGDDKIPAKLDELMKDGVTQELVTEEKVSFIEGAINSLLGFIPARSAKASDAAPVIKYHGQVTFSGTTVGDFTIDGVQAFCLEHSKASPPSNTPYNAVTPYNNEKIQKALYYGWGGPANIFTDREQGIVITSSVLSRLYSGQINGENNPGYSTLWDKVQNGALPNDNFKFSDTNLAVRVSDNKQISESTTLNADPTNSTTFTIPSNVRFVNESTGKGKTGGTITVKGGQRFHFEAPLNYNTTYNSGNLKGTMPDYQSLITIPKSSGYQVLGMIRVYQDPSKTASFTVPFKAQQVTHTVNHVDSYTGKTVKTTTTKRTIGTSYKVCPATDLKASGYNLVATSTCVSGTTPSTNFTTTHYYTSYHYLTLNYYDNYSGNLVKQGGRWTYKAGAAYSMNANLQFTHGTNKTLYKIVGSNAISGKMGRGDKVINVKYNPFQNITVKWQNKYPNYDVFKTVEERLVVGTQFRYTQPESFVKSGLYYDRENVSVFSGQLGYQDRSYNFYYKLRRTLTVNYLDNRTSNKINPSKVVIVHQGDSYNEKPPLNFKKDDYTYRYARTDGSPEKGVISKENPIINYYYDIPLVELGLKKVQIYTAKSTEGLPVKVELTTKYNYSKIIEDMNDPNKTVTVALYQGTKKLDSKKYKAKDIPTKIDFKIAPSELKVNTKKPYTVKIEGYNKNDFDVSSDAAAITTDGYTSSEETIEISSKDSTQLDFKGVVMTEREVGKNMELYYETLRLNFEKLDKKLTGYGFESPIKLRYTNDLGGEGINTGFKMELSNKLLDSYVNYPVVNNMANITLEKTDDKTIEEVGGKLKTNKLFELPHMNVEKETGYLFTDQQVADKDPRIKKSLIDGGRKFYTPIWGELGTYPITWSSTEKIGVHEITTKIKDNLVIDAYMYGHIDSPTTENDAILMTPINSENPYFPESWTEKDIIEFKEWSKKN